MSGTWLGALRAQKSQWLIFVAVCSRLLLLLMLFLTLNLAGWRWR